MTWICKFDPFGSELTLFRLWLATPLTSSISFSKRECRSGSAFQAHGLRSEETPILATKETCQSSA